MMGRFRNLGWEGRRGFLVQFTLTTVVPLGLVLVAFTVVATAQHQQAMRELVARRDLRTARLLARLWEVQWAEREQTLWQIALALQEHSEVRNEQGHPLRWLPLFASIFDRGLLLLQEEGEKAWAWDGGSWYRTTFALPPGQTLPVGSESAWFLKEGAEPEIWMMVPVDASTWLAGGFTLSSLGTYGALALEPPALLAVTDAKGRPLMVHIGPWPQGWDEAFAFSQEGGISMHTLGDEEYVIAYVRLSPLEGYLVLGDPWNATSSLWLQASEWIPLALIPVLLVSLALLWLVTRSVVRPLQALEARANAVTWGDVDALAEPVGGVEEIQRLQRTLHHMAEKIYRAHRNLRSYLSAVTAGQEEERRRLARELHDETLQTLIALQQHLQLAAQDLQGQPAVENRLLELQSLVAQAVQDLRRLIRNLRPLYLEELGLIPALETLVREVSDQVEGLQVDFLLQGRPRRLSPNEELALYRIVQEALNNVVRHAQATQAQVVLAFDPHQVRLEIRDNGRGFRVPETPADLAPLGHYGLLGMQERAERIGASLRLHSEPLQGTLVAVTLPYAETQGKPASGGNEAGA